MRITSGAGPASARRGCRAAWILALALSVGGPSVALAQQGPRISRGDRVRVVTTTWGGRASTATVEAVRPDTLVLGRSRPGGRESVVVPLTSIERLEVSVGRKSNAGKGALTGAIVGGSLGLILGIAAWAGSDDGDFLQVGPEAVPVSVAFFGGGGAILGTLIGALSHSDQWSPVPLEDLQLGLGPVQGGVAVGASVRVAF